MLIKAFLSKPHGGALLHAGCLDASAVESILEEAFDAGDGAQLALTVVGKVDEAELASVETQLGRLRDHGVQVRISRISDTGRPLLRGNSVIPFTPR
jgi:microcystin degradation protein MlrC